MAKQEHRNIVPIQKQGKEPANAGLKPARLNLGHGEPETAGVMTNNHGSQGEGQVRSDLNQDSAVAMARHGNWQTMTI